MQKWEYADFFFMGGVGKHREVRFTHHQDWAKVGANELIPTIRQLGEEGWELVSHSSTGEGFSEWWFKRPLAE